MLTAAQAVARTRGAGITVIAIERLPDALTCFAMIANRAGIAVQALTFVQSLVHTAIGTRTFIDRAGVTIVTRIFIDISVAIIIEAVAHLRCWFAGAATAKSRRFA